VRPYIALIRTLSWRKRGAALVIPSWRAAFLLSPPKKMELRCSVRPYIALIRTLSWRKGGGAGHPVVSWSISLRRLFFSLSPWERAGVRGF